jgi:hypothetical protein
MWGHSLLESEAILAAHTFLDRFLDLALTAHPELVVRRADGPTAITTTTSPSLNFLQLVIRTCQVGVGEPLAAGGNARTGMGRAAWQALVGRYEREVPWLREADAKEVRPCVRIRSERAAERPHSLARSSASTTLASDLQSRATTFRVFCPACWEEVAEAAAQRAEGKVDPRRVSPRPG